LDKCGKRNGFDGNGTHDMTNDYSKHKRESLLLYARFLGAPGEGQDEGIQIMQLSFLSPLPSPLPEGEGVDGAGQ
jgi:hypothetical protein